MIRVLFYILYLIFFRLIFTCYVFSINCDNIYYHYSIISKRSEEQAAFSSKQVSFHPLILTHSTNFCRPHNFPHSSHITSPTSCRHRRRRCPWFCNPMNSNPNNLGRVKNPSNCYRISGISLITWVVSSVKRPSLDTPSFTVSGSLYPTWFIAR